MIVKQATLAISAEIKDRHKWGIEFRDSDNNLVFMVAIPPTNSNRTDVIWDEKWIGDRGENCQILRYFFDFKENIKKLKGEKIAIKIENGNPKLFYYER